MMLFENNDIVQSFLFCKVSHFLILWVAILVTFVLWQFWVSNSSAPILASTNQKENPEDKQLCHSFGLNALSQSAFSTLLWRETCPVFLLYVICKIFDLVFWF